jgi:hypothetical protein
VAELPKHIEAPPPVTVRADGTLFTVIVAAFDTELAQPLSVQVAVYVPEVETTICTVVAPVDHNKLPVEHPLSKVTDVPQTTLFPPKTVTVGVAGVAMIVAITAERLAPAVSQFVVVFLHPT